MSPRTHIPEKTAASLLNWKAVTERLEEERRKTLPGIQTTEALQQFRLAWKAAKSAGLETASTGLIEQQVRFSRLKGAIPSKPDG